jgi:hypothetical protein
VGYFLDPFDLPPSLDTNGVVVHPTCSETGSFAGAGFCQDLPRFVGSWHTHIRVLLVLAYDAPLKVGLAVNSLTPLFYFFSIIVGSFL